MNNTDRECMDCTEVNSNHNLKYLLSAALHLKKKINNTDRECLDCNEVNSNHNFWHDAYQEKKVYKQNYIPI